MKNTVMLQAFEWEMNADGSFYRNLAAIAPELLKRGFDSVWLPPVCKATSTFDVGYGIYDLFDLGEFDQKGEVRTKYGTKDELLACIQTLHENNIRVYLDVVLNHKAGADFAETFMAVPVDRNDRTKEIGEARDIEAWTGFNFPGRNGQYSDFEWHFQHFTGVDYDQKSGENGIFRVLGEDKGWAYGVSGEKGNFDYLMFADIDHHNDDVRGELFRWADWFIETTNCDGFRFDAVKHIDDTFMADFSQYIKDKHPENFYMFAEYWEPSIEKKSEYLYEVKYNLDIFDVGLHFHMAEAAVNENYDLRTIFDNTVVKEFPMNCVTFVDNHDSQPGQSLESFIGRNFKERAYALILLRKDGYPCVFAGDYFGIHNGEFPQEDLQYDIERLLELRVNFAYGEQNDYFVDPSLIGWTRRGTEENSGLMACLISMKGEGNIEMDFGLENQGKTFRDYLNRYDHRITLDEFGKAVFPVQPASISVWVSPMADGQGDPDTHLQNLEERLKREKLHL